MKSIDAQNYFINCRLCPRNCNANRTWSDASNPNKLGYCGQNDTINLARAALHFWEEPCISGKNGSGAVFFCGCNLKCVFCQNIELANSKIGKPVSTERLAEIFLELQDQNAHNINLVSAGHFIPKLAQALSIAKNNGLVIPIVYNTGTYELVQSLKLLDGLIDIYLPDLKYMDSQLSSRLSNAPDYFDIATKAIAEMYSQVGKPVFNSDIIGVSDSPIIQKGVIVRHMVLPQHTKDSCNVLEYLYSTYGDDIYISILNQYTPMPGIDSSGFPELTHSLSKRAYEKVVNYAIGLGITNAFIQEGETFKDSFIPLWDYTGI